MQDNLLTDEPQTRSMLSRVKICESLHNFFHLWPSVMFPQVIWDQNYKNFFTRIMNSAWPVKSKQMSIKSGPKLISLEKWKILTPSTNCKQMWQFGENNCCHRLRKVSQGAINHPIWSHWLAWTKNIFIALDVFDYNWLDTNLRPFWSLILSHFWPHLLKIKKYYPNGGL